MAQSEQTNLQASQTLNLNTILPLQAFRSVNSGITPDEMELAASQGLILFDDLYAHLLLKQSMYAVDPVQSLRLLLQRARSHSIGDEASFHLSMMEIFNSVRDLHTNYLLPEPYALTVAFLPFLIEEYFDEYGIPHYPVTRIMPAAVQSPFTPGVEVTHWNGIPIANAIALNAHDHAGSNAAANHLQGLLTMTSRPLLSSLPPREDWVTLTYAHPRGLSEIRFPWCVFRPQPRTNAVQHNSTTEPAARALGLDIGLQVTHRARQILFKPESVRREAEAVTAAGLQGVQTPQAVSEDVLRNATAFPNEIEYGIKRTRAGVFGFLRFRSFDVPDHQAFVNEVVRILQLLPQEGLMLDVRGNPGGNILVGEHLLQLFTNRRIEPEPVCFRNTLGTLTFSRNDFLNIWRTSIDLAVQTGAQYSQYFPLSDPESVNSTGRRYPGRTVLLTDAACYSTTDFFAAGFQDHQIGPILGCHEFTGAGGANVWTHELLRGYYPASQGTAPQLPSPLQPLPRGMGMRIAFRRSTRVGARAGLPLEDLGVRCDRVHPQTKRDILENYVDLYEEAGQMIAEMIRSG